MWAQIAIVLIILLLLVIIILLLLQLYYVQPQTQPVYFEPPIEEDEEPKTAIIEEPVADIQKEGFYKYKGLVREQLVCQTLEKIYGVGFPTARPNFLKNEKTGRNLELDCFNENLRIAAEVNGIAHYVFPNKYHHTLEEFQDQVYRDQLKYDLCNKNNVYLITVPYWLPENMIEKWIEYYKPESVKTRQEIEMLLTNQKKQK